MAFLSNDGFLSQPISRRELFRAGACVLASTALFQVLSGCGGSGTEPGNLDSYILDVAFSDLNIGGRHCRLRTYNGQIPGPTMFTAPGHQFSVKVNNLLPANKPLPEAGAGGAGMGMMSSRAHSPGESPIMQNTPHDFNSTNLHVHGLQVQPHLFEPLGTTDANAPMLEIAPGTSQQYDFLVPDDQPSGMYFYHPHYHGSTLLQVVNGMAGVIIVKGPIDEVPEIAAAQDIPIALTDLGLFPSIDNPDIWTNDPTPGKYFNSQTGTPLDGYGLGNYMIQQYLVNGQPVFEEDSTTGTQVNRQLGLPDIQIRPGEVVRLRILNGTSALFMPLSFQGLDVHVIAYDGINQLAPIQIPYEPGVAQIELAPANRVELLIKAGQPGVHVVTQLAQTEQFAPVEAKDLFRIIVSGDPIDMPLPSSLPTPSREYPLPSQSEVSGTHSVLFSVVFPFTELPTGVGFLINNNLFDEFRVDHSANLGTVEEWTLLNNSTEGHPFHVHVNSFEVLSIGGVALPPGFFKDVHWVRPNEPVVIRMRFKTWIGKTVYHCHILPHEDTGMMQNLLIT